MSAQDIEHIKVVLLPDGRMTAKNAAKYLGVSEKTLAMRRCDGDGPEYIKRGRVFYFRKALDDWISNGRVKSTSSGA